MKRVSIGSGNMVSAERIVSVEQRTYYFNLCAL